MDKINTIIMKLREIWRFLVNLLKKYRWFILTVVWTALQIIIYQTCKSWIPYLIIFILCFCFYVVIRIIYFRKNSINFLRKYGWPIAITILVIIFLTPFIMVHYGMNPNDFFKFGFSDLKDFFTLWISSCGVAGLVVNIIHSQTRIRLQDKLIQQQEKQRRDNRFAKSVELLGHESGSTRIGGVYNLYFLAVEFFDEYGYYAISILSSHIRVITTTQDYQNKYKEATSDEIQSILDVLTRFSYPEESKDCLDKILSMLNTLIKSLLNKGFRINLANSHLAGANLMSADLRDVNLRGVNLLEADLLNADLTNACLEEAYLERVCFNRANLKKTNLQRANLKEANLKEAFSAATWSITTPAILPVRPGRIYVSSGSMDTVLPGALMFSFPMSPSPVTLVATSRFISLTSVFRSSWTVELAAASSTFSLATVPLATWT